MYFFWKHQVYKKRYKALIQHSNIEAINKLQKKNINIPQNTISDILNALNSFELKNGFLDNGISLNNLSKKINTNSSYLSKVINHYKDKSFSNYINDLRVNYVVQELKFNRSMRNHTVSAIAQDIGFNNSESFSNAFYKKTGIYPSFYIKQLNKDSSI